ncbi:MAG: hypothetical protein ACRDLN_16930 [Solirubrobacteraceae bacterium]
MSLIYTCNYCGETIDQNVPFVTLNGNGERSADHWRTGYVGHYHADPAVGCWNRILAAIRGCDAPRLDEIPTATFQGIAARRRKHRPLEPEDGTAAA